MLDRLFPSPAAFSYRGSRVAAWLAALLVIEHLARKGLAWLLPIERVGGASGGLVNRVVLALLLVALALSLRGPAMPENAA